MKTNFLNQLTGGMLALLLGVAVSAQAQQRTGNTGGFGGFGGGGGFGNNNRGSSSSSSSSYNYNGTVGSATVSVDPVTHNIIVFADKQTGEQIKQIIERMDEPEPQVLIKVVFLEVQHNNASDIGVEGSYTGNWLSGSGLSQVSGLVTNYMVQASSNGVNTVVPKSVTTTTTSGSLGNSFNLPTSLSSASGNGGLYQVLGNDFTATVQAIASAGKSQVLSRPSILARDGQMAEIVVGQQIYLPSGVTYSSVGTSGTTIPSINGTYTDVGIIMYVTPFIGANGLVEMIVQPENTSVDTSSSGQVITYGSSLISSSPVYAPNINVTEANTVVVTPNGQTVVIGGLISNVKASADSKVPFLGDIPFLGQLFKSSSKSDNRTELVIFLTPHIVDAPSQLMKLSTAEMAQTRLITNSVSEQELDRFLERVPVKKADPKGKDKSK